MPSSVHGLSVSEGGLRQVGASRLPMRAETCPSQVNARKIYDEADVLGGILDNKLFLGILGAEAALQVATCLNNTPA